MPKATLTFNLPEETYEHNLAINAHHWYMVVSELNEWLRSEVKYNGSLSEEREQAYHTVRDRIFEAIRDRCLEL